MSSGRSMVDVEKGSRASRYFYHHNPYRKRNMARIYFGRYVLNQSHGPIKAYGCRLHGQHREEFCESDFFSVFSGSPRSWFLVVVDGGTRQPTHGVVSKTANENGTDVVEPFDKRLLREGMRPRRKSVASSPSRQSSRQSPKAWSQKLAVRISPSSLIQDGDFLPQNNRATSGKQTQLLNRFRRSPASPQ